MKIFIRAASCISPQETFNQQLFFSDIKEYDSSFLKAIEPDYKNIIDVKLMRRMSRIVRTGLASAISCLKEAGKENVEAIITGTAYGCMEDSEKFLRTIVEQDEEMLSPTSFIQSTHNTVGAQIALFLKCHDYNNTFVHRGFSFEHALIDAMLLLNENKAENILAGSADEMTNFTFSVLKRFGMYKHTPISNLDLYDSTTKGSIAGEGTAFFLLTNKHDVNNYAELTGVETIYKPADLQKRIEMFLAAHKTNVDNIDLVITGRNGDVRDNDLNTQLETVTFKNNVAISFKHLCGEYPTASSFALWLAANILKQKTLPKCFQPKPAKKFEKILICNSYQNKYHSLMLLSACN